MCERESVKIHAHDAFGHCSQQAEFLGKRKRVATTRLRVGSDVCGSYTQKGREED